MAGVAEETLPSPMLREALPEVELPLAEVAALVCVQYVPALLFVLL